MKNRIKKFISAFTLATLLLAATASAPALAWNPLGSVCQGKGNNSSACKDSHSTGTNQDPLTGSKGLITKITRLVSIVAGIAAVIIIIVSGMKMVTSNGDAQAVAKARHGVIYALVGLILIVLAQAIIGLIVNSV